MQPDRGPGFFVKSGHELFVGAFEGDDEEILKENGRGSGALHVIAEEIAAPPEDVAARRVEGGGAEGAVVDVGARQADSRGREAEEQDRLAGGFPRHPRD